MKPSITALRIGLIIAACAMLVTGVQGASQNLGSNERDLRITAVDVQDQQVQITISNSGLVTRKATVTIQVRHTDGTQTAAASSVTVFGRQKAFVVFALRAPIDGAPKVGMIVDDPAPF